MDSSPAPGNAKAELSAAAAVVFSSEERRTLQANLSRERVLHGHYLRDHPEVQFIVQLGMEKILLAKPDDPVLALKQFFANEDLNSLWHVESTRRNQKQQQQQESSVSSS